MDAQQLTSLLGPWSGGSEPLYRMLAGSLRVAISRGDIPSGAKLPPERVFADALAVSRSTVVAAYELLREEEWIESRQGSGTRVKQGIAPKHLPRPDALPPFSARATLHDVITPGPHEVIDLSRGSPAIPSGLTASDFALPPDELAEILSGEAYQAQGLPELRREIAARYTREGLPTNEAQILITSGAQQAIALIAWLYIQRGDAVLIENPTYVGAIDAFRTAGARLIPATVEADGPRIDVLRGLAGAVFPRLIYVVPTFHNPTGTCMSAQKRIELAELAADLEVPLVTDDTLADLWFRDKPPASVASYADRGTVLTIGSLSKLFWGGLRIGWVRGPEAIITRLTRLKVVFDLGSTPLTQAIVTRLMPQCDRVKEIRRQELRPRYEILSRYLQEFLPSWTWTPPAGGIFIWAKLPGGDAREFAQVALRYGVLITPGTSLSVDDSHAEYVRLAFLPESDSVKEAVGRLARAWESYSSLAVGSRSLVSVVV